MAEPVVLIHGAWQGSWAWDAFTPFLRARGFHYETVDLPGNGTDATPPADVTLDFYVDHVLRVIGRLGRVSLIAHSGGAVVASQVAERAPEAVSRMVYVAGIMLPGGVSFGEIVAEVLPNHPEAAGIGPSLQWSPDRATSSVPPDAAATIFYNDCPPAVAAAAAARLTPQPEGGRAVAPQLSEARFGRVPRLYVEARQDRSVVPALQTRMQALVPGAEVVTLTTGHAPQLSAPAALAEAVLPYLAA